MGEFQEAVSHLLQAFARGVTIIKTQRGRRKKSRIPIDSTAKIAETHLNKTLKYNQDVVQDAYGKDLARHGPEFAKGDAEAHSSLSSILLRLNAGFVSVIERFTRGLSTPSDYETLLALSNASRQEAIDTFSLLSQRLYLSRSSLALVPLSSPHRQRRKKGSSSGVKTLEYETSDAKHVRSKSAPQLELAVTPLGLASPEGWVRPKVGRKGSGESSRSTGGKARSRSSTPRSSTTKSRSPPPSLPSPQIPTIRKAVSASPQSHQRTQSQPHTPPPAYQHQFQFHLSNLAPSSPQMPVAPVPSPHHYLFTSPQAQPQPPTKAAQEDDISPLPTSRPQAQSSAFQKNRKSIMSFASDSTKLGEIPEHKWARHGMLEEGNFPILTYYPLEPYKEPVKPRSRLRKLFRC